MEYTRLGSSGLKVSRIALGCMSFGDPSRGFNEWALDDEAAEPVFRQAVELGITFWDTANIYGYGTSEEITGRAMQEVHPPRGRRPGHQGDLQDGRQPGRAGPVPQGDLAADRRVAGPAKHRLR